MSDLIKLTDQYPFLSIGQYGNLEIIGVIQNSSKLIVSMYDYGMITDPKDKQEFISLAQDYWWNSNRKIGIDIFLRGEFDKFRKYLKSFNAKEFKLIHGPSPSLCGLATKRIKRKQITLIRRM